MKHKCPRYEILPRTLKGVGGSKSKFVKDNWGTTLRIFVWNISVRENRTTFSDRPLLQEITELKQRRRQKQRERQKTNSFGLTKQQLCTCIMLFVHFFLPSLHGYNVKVPNFTFCRGREHKTTTFFFFP